MHDDRFDDELKNRLGNYAEEPDDALWQGIAAGISSAPAAFSWLRWVSRGVLGSFTILSIVIGGVGYDSRFQVQGSKFQVQSSRLENGEEVVENSKLQIQNSKLGSDGVLVDGERSLLETRDPAVEVPCVQSELGAGDHPGFVARGSGVSEEDSQVSIQRSRLGEKESKVVARRSRAEVGDQKFEARCSNRDGQRSKFKVQGSRLEKRDSAVVARRARAGEQRSRFKVPGSRNEVQSSKFKVPGSGFEEGDSSLMARRARPVQDKDEVKSTRPIEQSQVVDSERKSKSEISVTHKAGDASQPGEDWILVAGPMLPPLYRDTLPSEQRASKAAIVSEVEELASDSSQSLRAARYVRRKAADKEKKDWAPRRTSLYFTAMPTLGYQRIEANASDNVIVESFDKVSNFSSRRLGIRAELGAECALTSRTKLFGGVLYYQRKQTISYVERVTTSVEHHTSGDTLTLVPHFALEDKAFEYELKNIGVQLGVNYVLRKRKFLHVAGTGIEFHKALNKLGEAQKMLGFSTNPSTYVFYNLYYRVQYPAEGRLRAIFQPTLNYSLFLNKDMNAPFYVKPYGLGLNLGVTYHF